MKFVGPIEQCSVPGLRPDMIPKGDRFRTDFRFSIEQGKQTKASLNNKLPN